MRRGGALVPVLLLVAAIPTAGASCVLLWLLASREARRQAATGEAPSRDVCVLRDVGIAGTVVFAVCVGLAAVLAGLRLPSSR